MKFSNLVFTETNIIKIKLAPVLISKTVFARYSTGIKGALKGLRQFLASESPFKKIKSTFYFSLKALAALKIFKFFS